MQPELAIISSELPWIWDIYFGTNQSHLHSFFRQCNFSCPKWNELPQPLVILRSECPHSLNDHGRDMYGVKSRDKVTEHLFSQKSHSIMEFTWTWQKILCSCHRRDQQFHFQEDGVHYNLFLCCNNFQLTHHWIRRAKKKNSSDSWNTDRIMDRTWISTHLQGCERGTN